MKKSGILNSKLSGIIAAMGHTDRLVICDAGLPIPHNANIVDLALTANIPKFIDTLKVILSELKVESAIIAKEFSLSGNSVYKDLQKEFSGIELKTVSHEDFKKIIRENSNISFVRTGETTSYANIILISGITFE